MGRPYDTPVKSIRKKCLQCTAERYKEVRFCLVTECAIYPYRMGRRPDKSTIESLKKHFLKNP